MNWDPTKWATDPHRWGSAGLIWNGGRDPRGLTDGRSGNGWNFDSKYVTKGQYAGSEGNGGQDYYEPTDYYNSLFDNGNKVQVRDVNRLKDQNAVEWGGDEIGWVTNKNNYTDDTDWVDKAFEAGTFGLLGAAPFMHMAGVGSWLGSEGAANGGGAELFGGDLPAGTEIPNTYAPGADPTQFYVPGGVESSAGAGAFEPFGNGLIESAAGTAPSAASGGLLDTALSGIPGASTLVSGLLSNPAAALGLFQMARGLIGGGGSGGGSGGGGSGGSGTPISLKASRGAWTPNPITAQQIQNFKFYGS